MDTRRVHGRPTSVSRHPLGRVGRWGFPPGWRAPAQLPALAGRGASAPAGPFPLWWGLWGRGERQGEGALPGFASAARSHSKHISPLTCLRKPRARSFAQGGPWGPLAGRPGPGRAAAARSGQSGLSSRSVGTRGPWMDSTQTQKRSSRGPAGGDPSTSGRGLQAGRTQPGRMG